MRTSFIEIPDILESLQFCNRAFPRRAVEAAVEKRTEITPELLHILEDTVENVEELFERDPEGQHFAHIHALHLLAQFREVRAYPLVIRLARLDSKTLDNLVGDLTTENFDRILASVCGGDTGPIEALVEDPTVDQWVRGAALGAMLVLVQEKALSREKFVTYCRALFERKLERRQAHIWNKWSDCILDLPATELADHLRTAFELGLINDIFISPDSVVRELHDKKSAMDLSEHKKGYIESAIDELKNHACFLRPREQATALVVPTRPAPTRDLPTASKRPISSVKKIGRNAPCPCGSSKKYKKCCGRVGS